MSQMLLKPQQRLTRSSAFENDHSHRHFTRNLPKRMPGAAVVIHCCFSSKHSFLPPVVTKQKYNDIGCWFDECIECTEYFINMLAIPYLWDPRSHDHLWAYARGTLASIYVCVIYVLCVDGFLYKRSVNWLMPVVIINCHPQDSSPPYNPHFHTKTSVFVQRVYRPNSFLLPRSSACCPIRARESLRVVGGRTKWVLALRVLGERTKWVLRAKRAKGVGEEDQGCVRREGVWVHKVVRRYM